MQTWMRFAGAAALACLASCTSKSEQIDKCRYLGGVDDVGRCLVSRYNWSTVDATIEQFNYHTELEHFQDSMLHAVSGPPQKRDTTLPGENVTLLDRQGPNLFARVQSRFPTGYPAAC